MSIDKLLIPATGSGPIPALNIGVGDIIAAGVDCVGYINTQTGYEINDGIALTTPGTASVCVGTVVNGDPVVDSKLTNSTYVGYSAGGDLVVGATGTLNNSFIGTHAGDMPAIGQGNSVFGALACYGPSGSSIGNYNTMVGSKTFLATGSTGPSSSIGNNLQSLGANRMCLDHTLMSSGAATDASNSNLLCNNSSTNEVVATKNINFPVTFSGLNNPKFSGTIYVTGSNPLTLNTQIGIATYAIASPLSAGSQISLTLGNSLVGTGSVVMSFMISTSFAVSGSNNSYAVQIYNQTLSNGGITWGISNNGVSGTNTGSNWTMAIGFIILAN